MMAMMPAFLAGLRLGKPVRTDNLAMVPLFHDQNVVPDYLTLEEGIDNSCLVVEEVDESGSVNDILFRNKSDKKALLFEGEEFLGAKQNRILNVSIFADADSKQVIPVSCVEAGRWQHRSKRTDQRRFRMADRMHYARGRAAENSAVNLNLAARNEYRGNQSGVWQDIRAKSARLNAQSQTGASDAMFQSTAELMDKHVTTIKHKKKQIGSAFVVDGVVSGVEIFASEKTHAHMLPRLVRSYALDAIDNQRMEHADTDAKIDDDNTVKRRTKEFIEGLQNSWIKETKGVCLGHNIRFQDEDITGGALVHDDTVLHLCAFATAS